MSSDKVILRYQGKDLSCRAGTTVAAALWENGIRVLSHSPKYGRPRGVTCARGQCTACLMRVDGVPNIRACETPVQDGMNVEKQDTGAFYGPVMQKTLASADSLFPVGFYYKWFTKPAALSRLFLNGIRPLTGVGRITTPNTELRALPEAPGTETRRTLAEDLGARPRVVVGGGPSGMAAALADNSPAVVLDDHTSVGGQRALALREACEFLGERLQRFPILGEARQRLAEIEEQFAARDDLTFLGDMKVVAGYQPSGLLVRRGRELASIDFEELIWAAGAMDTLGLFPGNDTPGLIGPRALYRLLTRDGLVVEGKPVLVMGHGLDFWLSAALLAARGAQLALVITESGNQTEVSAAVDAKWQLTTGLQLASIRSISSDRISATLVPKQSTPGPLHTHLQLEADLAVVCNSGKPSFDVPYQVGVEMVLQPEAGGFVPDACDENGFRGHLPGGAPVRVVGEAAGTPARSSVPGSEERPAS